MEKRKTWLLSKYNENVESPFTVGEFYHLGTKNEFGGNFVYRGVAEYTDNGFIDNQGYNLKPFPTHYIHIERPLDPS